MKHFDYQLIALIASKYHFDKHLNISNLCICGKSKNVKNVDYQHVS